MPLVDLKRFGGVETCLGLWRCGLVKAKLHLSVFVLPCPLIEANLSVYAYPRPSTRVRTRMGKNLTILMMTDTDDENVILEDVRRTRDHKNSLTQLATTF